MFCFIYPVKRDISISVINILIIGLLLAIRILKATLSKFQLFQEKSVTIGGQFSGWNFTFQEVIHYI